jgi:enoyl-[acyl-carrier protein] reductase II
MGIFEGDEIEGQMEAGQGAALIKEILPVKDIFNQLITGYKEALHRINNLSDI